MNERVRCYLVPYLLGLSARHLAIAGQYFGGLCGSPSGRVSVGFDLLPRLLCILRYFVSFPPVAPSCLISAVPIQSVPSACFAPLRPFHPVPIPSCSRSSSSAHALLASSPIASPFHLMFSPSRPVVPHIPIVPHRFHAPPAVSVELGVFAKRIEFDAFKIMAAERLLPTACLPSDEFHAAPSTHPIASSNMLCFLRPANMWSPQSLPAFTPRPACRRTGRICLDAMRSIP